MQTKLRKRSMKIMRYNLRKRLEKIMRTYNITLLYVRYYEKKVVFLDMSVDYTEDYYKLKYGISGVYVYDHETDYNRVNDPYFEEYNNIVKPILKAFNSLNGKTFRTQNVVCRLYAKN